MFACWHVAVLSHRYADLVLCVGVLSCGHSDFAMLHRALERGAGFKTTLSGQDTTVVDGTVMLPRRPKQAARAQLIVILFGFMSFPFL